MTLDELPWEVDDTVAMCWMRDRNPHIQVWKEGGESGQYSLYVVAPAQDVGSGEILERWEWQDPLGAQCILNHLLQQVTSEGNT